MRKTINVLICIVFVLSTIALASNTGNFIIVPDWYDIFDCNNKQQIVSGESAKTNALCDEYVKKSLLNFQDNIPYKKWQVTPEKDENTDEWIVRIKSKGFIPSASCLIKMHPSGNIYFKECQFNK